MKRLILLSLLSLLTFGCGHIASQIKPETRQNLGKIGVISIVQEKAVLIKVGTTVFNNIESEADVDWKLNDFILKIISKELTTNSRINFIIPSYSPHELEQLYSSTTAVPYFDYDFNNIKDNLTDLSKQHSIDSILLISTSISSDIVGSTNQEVHGQGLYFRTFGPYASLRIYVLAKMQLINAKTMTPIAQRLLFTREEAENMSWKASYSDYTISEKTEIERIIKAIFRTKLIEQMTKIGLVDHN
jgi:hypothetical protein